MPSTNTKELLLKAAGFRYNYHRELFVNRSARKAFSVEFVEDHTEDELERCIRDSVDRERWRFYFNRPPSDYVRAELSNLLG